MEKVREMRELKIVAQNRTGMLADLTKRISGRGVNIENACAYNAGGDAFFHLIVSDPDNVRDVLREGEYHVEERNVILMSLENRPGALSEIAEKFKAEGIDLEYIYGTTSEAGSITNMVFSSANNRKAMEVARFMLSLSRWGK